MQKTILLGITGGIAAYKTPALVRLLARQGLQVNVVTTKAAPNFVSPLSLATVSGRPVFEDMWGDRSRPSVEHIDLADSADLAVIAPATANIIAKIAAGIADDMLTTVLLALTCPVLICPSMNVNMFRNPLVQANLAKLKQLGFHVLEPESGWLACGWTGEGRMPEPEVIASRVVELLGKGDLAGLRILVTAGPTEEPIDPVRFITNRSSGKMGVAISRKAVARGADVTLVAAPLKVAPPEGPEVIRVRTAVEMREKVLEKFPAVDIVIKAAAVADFRPESSGDEKIKKEGAIPTIKLVRNPDILLELGGAKRPDQTLVGFAAETENILENARKKLTTKNLDMLVLNDVSKPGAGFDYDTNIVRFLYPDGNDEEFGIMSKQKVADLILDRVLRIRGGQSS
jgi:phosphopantothenoylcysteine decarboxylase / phosphopantothenate---cysteine ligase